MTSFEKLSLKTSYSGITVVISVSEREYLANKIEEFVREWVSLYQASLRFCKYTYLSTTEGLHAFWKSKYVQRVLEFRSRHLTVKISSYVTKSAIIVLKISGQQGFFALNEGYDFIKLLRNGMFYREKGSFFIKLTHLWESGVYEGVKSISRRILLVNNSLKFVVGASWAYSRLGFPLAFTPLPLAISKICKNLDEPLSLVKFGLKTFAVYNTYVQSTRMKPDVSEKQRAEKNWKFRIAILEFTEELAKKTLRFTPIKECFPTAALYLECGVNITALACASYGWIKCYER